MFPEKRPKKFYYVIIGYLKFWFNNSKSLLLDADFDAPSTHYSLQLHCADNAIQLKKNGKGHM